MSLYVRGDFHVCPNPLCCDPYSICEYNCHYCFTKEMESGILKRKAEKGLRPNKVEELKRKLRIAFDTRQESKDPAILGLREGLPVLVGRKCDPLCPSERKYGVTLKMLRELKRYNVPSIMETKGVTSDHAYFDNLSGVLVSLTPGTENLHDALEPGTPSFGERIKFAKILKDSGLWVGLVAEPIIPSVNDKQELFEEYSDMAVSIGVDHICFGGYRVHNPKLAY